MKTNGAEMFARLDTASGLMAKGFVGKGNGDGKLNDEDWGLPFAIFVPYSNTISKVDDHIRYGVVDVGYDLWRDERFRAAPFVGYSIFHQYMQGFGCTQLANPNSDCGTPIPTTVFAISEDDTWQAMRLGAVVDAQIVPGLTLTAEAAYLPYVRFRGTDDHILRSLLSPEQANGSGTQLEVTLSYAVTDQLSLGVGGRYSAMWTPDGTVDFGGTGTIVPMRYSVEQAALLVQGSYMFADGDSIRRATSEPAFRNRCRKAAHGEVDMDKLSRRDMLVATAAGGLLTAAATAQAGTFGNPDEPPQGAINTLNNPSSTTVIGPNNPTISGQFPAALSPPATDVGNLPLFWATFNNAPRRIQNGGWAREVTQADFQISEDDLRRQHAIDPAASAKCIGTCRPSGRSSPKALPHHHDRTSGRANVEDVREGGLWYSPPGLPHSLQGVGDDGCEFIICFDDGRASEYNTLLLTDWIAHTPPDVLALNFGVPAETFAKVPLTRSLYLPGDAARPHRGRPAGRLRATPAHPS